MASARTSNLFPGMAAPRRLTETSQVASGDFYRDLCELTGDLIQCVAPDGAILYTNAAGREALGYDEEDLRHLDLWDILHPVCARDFQRQFQRMLHGERLAHVELTFIARDGRRIEVEGSCSFGFREGQAAFSRGIYRLANGRRQVERVLRALHGINAAPSRHLDDRLRALLTFGCQHFDLPIGMFSHIDGQNYEIVQAICPDDVKLPGDVFDLGATYCAETVSAEGPVCFERAADSQWKTHPCFHQLGVQAYLGQAVLADGRVYGTLTFSSLDPRARAFTAADKEALRLMTEWLGNETARHRAEQALRRSEAHYQGLYERSRDHAQGAAQGGGPAPR